MGRAGGTWAGRGAGFETQCSVGHIREEINIFPVTFPAGPGRHHSSRRQIWEEQTPHLKVKPGGD